MNIRDGYNSKKVATFDMQDRLDNKIDKLTPMMGKLTAQGNKQNKQFKPKIYMCLNGHYQCFEFWVSNWVPFMGEISVMCFLVYRWQHKVLGVKVPVEYAQWRTLGWLETWQKADKVICNEIVPYNDDDAWCAV